MIPITATMYKYWWALAIGMLFPEIDSRPREIRNFRSWGESQIGRMLDRHGIPFQHEHPLAVVEVGRTRIWYPDFQLPGYGIIIEYFGRVHDPSYAEGMTRKQAVYQENGVSALTYTPDIFRGNWPDRILGDIEGVLSGRMKTFQEIKTKNRARMEWES